MPIVYNYKKILEMFKKNGYNTTRIRKEKLLGESVLQKLRDDEGMETGTIGKLCKLAGCQPGDFMNYIEDEE